MIFKYIEQYMLYYLGLVVSTYSVNFGYRLACEKGFHGNCDMRCPFPFYGHTCQSLCNCNVTYCHHVNGCRQVLGETQVKTK